MACRLVWATPRRVRVESSPAAASPYHPAATPFDPQEPVHISASSSHFTDHSDLTQPSPETLNGVGVLPQHLSRAWGFPQVTGGGLLHLSASYHLSRRRGGGGWRPLGEVGEGGLLGSPPAAPPPGIRDFSPPCRRDCSGGGWSRRMRRQDPNPGCVCGSWGTGP
jgi:hypothetical protein